MLACRIIGGVKFSHLVKVENILFKNNLSSNRILSSIHDPCQNLSLHYYLQNTDFLLLR